MCHKQNEAIIFCKLNMSMQRKFQSPNVSMIKWFSVTFYWYLENSMETCVALLQAWFWHISA